VGCVLHNLIQNLIGVPYKKNGRDMTGLDCLGLVKVIDNWRGVITPDYDSPEEYNLIDQIIKEEKEEVSVELSEPEPFCKVTFCIRYPYVTHIGVVLEDCRRFIHILRKQNVAVERLDNILWQKRIRGFHKWKSELVL